MLTKRKRSFAGFIFLSLLLVGFSAQLLIQSEIQRWDARFRQHVQIVTGAVRNQLDTNEAVLAGFSAFLQAVDQGDETAAARYAAAIVAAYPQIYMLEVARAVPRHEQHAFEELLRLGWRADFQLKDFSSLTHQPPTNPLQLEETWPVLFMYPQLPEASALYGVRLETVGYLSHALARGQRTRKPVASPVFTMYEGGDAYILLQPVSRPVPPRRSEGPNFFGSTMVALILVRTDAMRPALPSANLDPLLAIEAFLDVGAETPSRLFSAEPEPASALDRLLLPRLTERVHIDSGSQPTTLLFERQLRLSDVLAVETLTVLLIIVAALVVLPAVLIRHFRAVAAAEREYEHSTFLATHDILTRLPNRHLLADRFGEAHAYWRRHGVPFALMVLDLDRFKAINDRLGHEIGDQVLQAIAERLRNAVRAYDTAARYGGDEFILLIRDVAGSADAAAVAQSILLATSAPIPTNAGELQMGCSIGVALCPDHGNTFDALLSAADQAMYRVKREGRNGVPLAGARKEEASI